MDDLDDDFPFAGAPAANGAAANVYPIRDPDFGPEPPAYGDPQNQSPLPIQWFDDIEQQLTGLWLVKRLLPAVGIAVLYGHAGSGKTFLALDWALHIAAGWDWQGHKVKQGLVVYVCAEGVSGLRNRVEAFRRHHGATGLPFALIPCPIDMQAPDADVGRLIAAVKQAEDHFGQQAVLTIIDTLSKTFGSGKENTDDMVGYVANCQRVSNEFESLTMPVHHRPKDAESEDPRGHSSLKGGSETVIIVEAGETKRARITKQKDGEDGIELLFRLKVIELGEDEDGEPVTSCVVEAADVDLAPRGDTLATKAAHLPDSAKLALNHLDETAEQSGTYPPTEIPDTEINRAKVGKVVRFEDWRQKALSSAGTDRDTAKRVFNRALVRLQKDGIVRVWGDYAWCTWEAGTSRDNHRDNGGTKPGQAGQNGGVLHTHPQFVPAAVPGLADDCPAWMDQIPDDDLGADIGDWKDNPILNGGRR